MRTLLALIDESGYYLIRLASDVKEEKMGPEASILLHRYAAVYIEIPKVACTSMKAAFAQLLGINLAHSGGNPHQVSFPSPARSRNANGPLFPGLFTFAFVRNPWDRLVSCYRDKIAGEVAGFTGFTIRPGVADCLADFATFRAGMSFDDFVTVVVSIPDAEADAHFRSQHTFVTNEAGELAIDFVGRYETLLIDFQHVQQRLSLSDIHLPWLQAAPSRVNYHDYYTSYTRQMVAERFQKDIALFAYEFDG